MRASLLAATTFAAISFPVLTDAQICPNPLLPPCCPSPCPVIDGGSLAQIVADFSAAKDYIQAAKGLYAADQALTGVLQHGITLPSLSGVLSPSLRLPVLTSAGTSLDGYWQTPQTATAQAALKTAYAAAGRDAAVSAYGGAFYLPASLNSELSPSILQALNAVTSVTNFADTHSAGSYSSILPTLGAAQAGTVLSGLVAMKATQVQPGGNYASTANLTSTTSSSSAAASTSSASTVASQQQRLSQLAQSLSTLVAFNNARVSAVALVSTTQPGDGNTSQASAQLAAATSTLTATLASIYANPAAAAAAIETFLLGQDKTTYTDNFSKAVAAQNAATALAQVLSNNPGTFGALVSNPSGTPSQISAAATGFLDAYKNAQFASQISQTVQAAQQQSNQMLQSLNTAWGVDLTSTQAAQQQAAMASALLSQFNANADLASVSGYSNYLAVAQLAASDAKVPIILTF